MSKGLWLGTVQLGLSYGIANQTGQPDIPSANKIITESVSLGYSGFDTAQAYGSSEKVLGECFASSSTTVPRVVTKLRPDLDISSESAIREAVEASLDRLRVGRLWGLLLHREEQLAAWDGTIGKCLRALVREGTVEHIGASVYSPRMALGACDCDGLDLLQIPASCLDRRMERSGLQKRAESCGVTLHVRSVFLQGLALMDATRVPSGIPSAQAAVATLDRFCSAHHLDRRHFALSYAKRAWPDSGLVVGAETVGQVRENADAFRGPALSECAFVEWETMWSRDEPLLVDPSKWPALSVAAKS